MAIEFIRTMSEGKKIYGILHLPRNPSPPFVVASHGLFSSKESEKFIAIGEFFSTRGIAVIRYDHQGCGESEGDLSATTASSRIKDLEAIVDLTVHHPLLGDRFGLLGSSMGGFVSIFKGATDLRVKALALWATPSHLGDKKDVEDAENPPLREEFYRDLEQYDARGAIKNLENCLILHGEADELVPLSQAGELYAAARSPKHLEVFPEGDHRFSNSQHRLRAIKMSFEWFQKYL